MRDWRVHRDAGLRLRVAAGPAVGTEFATGIGVGPLRLWAPCRVVWLRDEPGLYGYGFGTLPGHPARGEESFAVTLDDEDRVWFSLRAFSRPATWYARLGRPVAELLQDAVTDRYVRAAQRAGI
jgi:uncharacterized protein (UPF0548 family)